MEIIGKPTLNPVLFYTGKISGYITWIVFVYSVCNERNMNFGFRSIASFCLFTGGFVLTILSLLYLGKSLRLGLPVENTLLKSDGIYKISRNPMYVGFGMFTIASMIYNPNVAIIICGIFSLMVYHLIIKSEENFLSIRFGKEYENYRKTVRRYL